MIVTLALMNDGTILSIAAFGLFDLGKEVFDTPQKYPSVAQATTHSTRTQVSQ